MQGRAIPILLLLAPVVAPAQAAAARAAESANFKRCLAGQTYCDMRKVSPQQRQRVFEQARRNHLESCLAGLTVCDESLLGPAELSQVRERASERNYALCLQGAFVDCREDELSAEQRTRVERRREGNLVFCTHSLVGCVPELLTAEEHAQVAASRSCRHAHRLRPLACC